MSARVIQNQGKNAKPMGAPKVQIKNPMVKEEGERPSQTEVKMTLAQAHESKSVVGRVDRAQFYDGQERMNLQGSSVQRVRELQEENDHLQREIVQKENEIADSADALAILADIEHRKVIIARNTGEILKIYLRNEERLKRVRELEAHNVRIQSEMTEMQGKFISTKDMDEKTRFASEFFILKSEIERNLHEINELSKK